MSPSPLPARRGFFERLTSAVGRRARSAWARLTGHDEAPPVRAALDWLLSQDTGQGVAARVGEGRGCPGVTGACLGTVLNYGHREVAARWARWLLSVQRPDGAFDESSFDRNAWAIGGLLEVVDFVPEAEAAIRRACEYLCAWLDRESQQDRWSDDADRPEIPALPHVTPLLEAGRRWANADWIMSALGAADYFVAPQPEAGVYPFGVWMEFTLQRDGIDVARQCMEPILSGQKPEGSVSHAFGPSTVLGFERAHLAQLWYRLGWREQADRALQGLEQHLRSEGPFELGAGWFTPDHGRHESALAAKLYLDAVLLRVQTAFEAHWQDFPDEIDPADGRMEAVRQWLASLPADARVADVGCGRGRFLRQLATRFPKAQLTGIDISPAMLDCLPDGIDARQGSLLRIPAADGQFDGAFSVEALEHALLPERAIAELCRVVRPGGRVLVIDKHLAKQSLSEHDPWERWFSPEELAAWLARACDGVRVRRVSHLEGRPGRDLFLAAEGVRRR
jgi:malonyl-CoA O-methyltransferase